MQGLDGELKGKVGLERRLRDCLDELQGSALKFSFTPRTDIQTDNPRKAIVTLEGFLGGIDEVWYQKYRQIYLEVMASSGQTEVFEHISYYMYRGDAASEQSLQVDLYDEENRKIATIPLKNGRGLVSCHPSYYRTDLPIIFRGSPPATAPKVWYSQVEQPDSQPPYFEVDVDLLRRVRNMRVHNPRGTDTWPVRVW